MASENDKIDTVDDIRRQIKDSSEKKKRDFHGDENWFTINARQPLFSGE